MDEAPTAQIVGVVLSPLTVTVPPEPLTGTAEPAGSEATIPVIPTVRPPAAVPPAMFKRSVAIGPGPSTFSLRPKMSTRTVTLRRLPDALFPAAAAAAPVVVET